MNNEELKEKIVDTMHPILKGTRVSCNEEDACEHCLFPCEVDRIVDRLADALIAAGIGDVKEAEAEANRYEMLYKMQSRDMALAERKAYESEHRAARAERALRDAFEIICNGIYDVNEEVAEALKQAEKELAEEGKDDQ